MSYWRTYCSLFGETIDKTQNYETAIQSMLKDIDKNQDPCHAHKQLLYLKNVLKTKSDGCYSIRKIFLFTYDYKGQTRIRSDFFERQAENAYTQCLQYTAKHNELRKNQHQLDIIKVQQETKLKIQIQREITQRQRIRAMEKFTKTEIGVRPQDFRK